MPGPEWLDERESAAWRAYVVMGELLRAQLASDLQRETGLSDADYTVLVQLSEAPGRAMRMSDLAARLWWSKSRLSHQVGRMEERGLVERADCPTDARGSLAVLTDQGFDEIVRASPAHVASVRRHLIDQLEPAQLDALADISTTVLAHLQGAGPPCGGIGPADDDCAGEPDEVAAPR